jgi:antitoxin-like ribbon-helix-helix protein
MTSRSYKTKVKHQRRMRNSIGARSKAGKAAIRKSYKSALTKLNIEAWRQLKRLAIDKDKPVSELQREAINLLFAKHGLPQIAERWTAED